MRYSLVILVLVMSFLIKPKCQNIWFYKDGMCHEYCAEGDWSQVSFCKKRVEGHWGTMSYGFNEAGWMCKKSNSYNDITKCTMRCFENDLPITLTTSPCDKVVY